MEQTEQNTEQNIEENKFTFLSLILRTFAGFGGGIAGTVILLVIFMLTSQILTPVLAPSEGTAETNPLFLFVLMALIFASTLGANLISPLLISFTQRDKYKRITTSMFQIFIINIIVFVILIPVYLYASGAGTDVISIAAGLHIAFSVMASALVFEIISNYKYALLGVYSTMFAVLGGIAFNVLLFQATGTGLVLLFVTLPVLWGGVGFVHGIIIMFYQWIVTTWGTDYLATTQEYSKDYGVTEEEEEIQEEIEKEEEPTDEAGTDFLRKD